VSTSAPPTALAQALGAVVRRERSLRGETIEAFADLAGMNVTYLSDIERGRQNPSLRKIEDLAKTLGVRVSFLVSEAEELLAERQRSGVS
jgi:transcriptional regulator with XRE-family HTH domain